MTKHTAQRRKHGITREQLASITGYSAETIRQYEAGSKKPSQRFVSLYTAAVETLTENPPPKP